MQCLLVDDDLDDQEVFLMTLEKINKDIKCLTANNGVEALSLLSHNSFVPDYIFLDVNMPKMNGIECLKNIKDLSHLNDCKIFMYSTTSETSVLEKSKSLGATDFIVKPASPATLKATLSVILNN
ncbi:MAG: response regulator [Parafilimonas sp.]|nr:response regulator [Parafilimonas sp.]